VSLENRVRPAKFRPLRSCPPRALVRRLPASRHLPADWHACTRDGPHFPGKRASTRLAPQADMTEISRSLRQVANTVSRVFGRLATLIIGFIMMVVGLAMTATIVMLPVGVVLGLLGVAFVVAGTFAAPQAEGLRDR
jgi:hypothetical protein